MHTDIESILSVTIKEKYSYEKTRGVCFQRGQEKMNNEKKTKTQWKRETHTHIRKPNYANRITESLTPVIITKKKTDFF